MHHLLISGFCVYPSDIISTIEDWQLTSYGLFYRMKFYFCVVLQNEILFLRSLKLMKLKAPINGQLILTHKIKLAKRYTCAQRRFRSACTSDQTLRCPHEHALHPWLCKTHSGNIMIRLLKCVSRSESS